MCGAGCWGKEAGVAGASGVLEAVGVPALPPPGVGTRLLDAQLRPPPEDVGGQRRVGVAGGDVTGPAADDLVGDAPARRLFEGGDELEHRRAPAGAEVDGFGRARLGQVVEGGQVAPGQVDDVDVVPDAGAVYGDVVGPGDLQRRPAPDGHLAT